MVGEGKMKDERGDSVRPGEGADDGSATRLSRARATEKEERTTLASDGLATTKGNHTEDEKHEGRIGTNER